MNSKQIIGIIIAVLGVLTLSTAQLSDIFGPQLAKTIASISAVGSSILGSVLAAMTTQTATVKDVQAMPGIEKITVNKDANPTLAAMAISEDNQKVEAKVGSEVAVARIAGDA